MARITRAQAVRKAHRMGLTLRGFGYYSAGGERALAERTGSSIRKQAQSEMAAAYAPAAKSFDRREQQINSLDAKRQADEAAYRTWVTQKQAEIATQAQTARETLNTLADNHTNQLATNLGQIRSDNAARQQAIGGTQAPPDALAEAQQGAILASDQNSRNAVTARQRIGVDMIGAVQSNTLAHAASISAHRQSETLAQLAAVADDRDKALLQQGSDVSKRIAELLAGEGTNAQARIAQGQFDQKLRLDARKFDAAERDKKLGRGVTKRGQDLSHADRVAARAQKDRQKAQDFFAKYGMTPEEFARHSQKGRQRIIDNAPGGGAGGKGAKNTPKQLQDNRNQLSRAADLLNNGIVVGTGKSQRTDSYKGGNVNWGTAPDGRTTRAQQTAINGAAAFLRRHGWSKEYAEAAAWTWAKRNGFKGPVPKGVQGNLKKVAGIRGL